MKRGASFLLSLAVCPFILYGCESLANEGKTTVTFQTWNPADTGPDSPIYKVIDSFEKENPDIKIKYVYVGSDDYQDHLRVELLSGKGPDVFGISCGSAFDASREFEEDITKRCEDKWGGEWKSRFLDSCIEDVSGKDGHIYGLPLGQTYGGYLWADVNLLDQYGLEVPSDYSEMKETCSELRENGQMPLVIGAKTDWLNLDMWMSIAADIDSEALYDAIEGRASFESEPVIESFRIWQECFENGVFQDKAVKMPLYDTANDMFQREGTAAMFANGSWAMNMYTLSDEKTNKNFNGPGADHDVFLIDWNDDGKIAPVTASVDVILCMNPEAKDKDAAFRWMDYLVNEGQEILVGEYLEYMPSLSDFEMDVKGLSDDGKENLEFIIENGKTNVAGGRGIQYEDLNLAVTDALGQLAAGRISPEEAARQIQEVSGNTVR